MAKTQTLLQEIERDLLDGKPLADVLRKVVILGGRAGSGEMRDWAGLELSGYAGSEAEIPGYRGVDAPIRVDGQAGNTMIKGQSISPMQFPEFAREAIKEHVQIPFGVGELEALVRNNKPGESIRLGLPGGADLAFYMNSESNDSFRHIESLYWAVSYSAIEGVLDKIRTKLAELVSELKAAMPETQETPNAEQAAAAVNFVVSGKRSKVTFTNSQAVGGASTVVQSASNSRDDLDPPWWTLGRKIGAFVVGLCVIAGTVIALIALVA